MREEKPRFVEIFPTKNLPKIGKRWYIGIAEKWKFQYTIFWTKVDGKTKTEGFIVKNKCIRIIFHRAICAENVADKP